MGNALFGVAEVLFWILVFWCYGSYLDVLLITTTILGVTVVRCVLDRPDELLWSEYLVKERDKNGD